MQLHPTVSKSILFLMGLCLFSLAGYGQGLKRQASLGFSPQELTAKQTAAMKIPASTAIKVTQIQAGGTLAQLNTQEGDIILSMNEQAVLNIRDLLNVRAQLRDGDPLKIKVWRNGKTLDLTGNAVGIPKETHPRSTVIYDEFKHGEGIIRTIVNRSPKPGKQPTIFFIPGYTCSSVDNLHPIHPYRKLVDSLAGLGYHIFRMEKPGIGDNLNTGDCQQLGFDQEMDAYYAGYQQLLQYDFVDKDNIFIWGHSMGGIYAPLLAQKTQPKGVVVYGIIHDTWTEYLLRMVRYQNPLMGTTDYIKTDEEVRILYALLYEHYHLGKTSKELAKNPDYKRILERDFAFDGDNQILFRHEDFWREIYAHNLSKAWGQTKSYVLSMNGEADLETVNNWSQRALVDVVNHYHPGRGTFLAIPQTDHSMIRVGTLQEGAILRSQPQYRELMDKQFNYDIIQHTHTWIQDKLNKPITTTTSSNN